MFYPKADAICARLRSGKMVLIKEVKMRLIYVLDPMCAWCYAFEPELSAFLNAYPNASVERVMGGLAPDNDNPMDDTLRLTIASYWHQIERTTQVCFNHDYWHLNTPFRSTYPACRAVLAAQKLSKHGAEKMVKAIQSAYYQQAKNPSLRTTLIHCAEAIGLDTHSFTQCLQSTDIESQLQQHLQLTKQLNVVGFPSLFYITEKQEAFPLTLGFCKTHDLVNRAQHATTL